MQTTAGGRPRARAPSSGSAKGVMFITAKDEIGVDNLVVWSRRLITPVLPAGMAGVYGKVQRERSVVHLVAHRLTDLSAELDSVGDRGGTFPTQRGRGDELRHGSRYRDPRGINLAQDTRNPREHIDQIKAPTPDFR